MTTTAAGAPGFFPVEQELDQSTVVQVQTECAPRGGNVRCPLAASPASGSSSAAALPATVTEEAPYRVSRPAGGFVYSLAAASAGEGEELVGRRRTGLAVVLGAAALMACMVLAALAAVPAEEPGLGGDFAPSGTGATMVPAPAYTSAPLRSLTGSGCDGAEGGPSPRRTSACRIVQEGEPCYRHVTWAMTFGIHQQPSWYLNLTANSSFEAFQARLHMDSWSECPLPCGFPTGGREEVVPPRLKRRVGVGHWCEAEVPDSNWNLKACDNNGQRTLRVQALTYNLFWWSLFGRRRGNDGSAGRLIAEAVKAEGAPFDVMAFQEADNIWWPLGDAGLNEDEYSTEGDLGMALVWRRIAWKRLGSGIERIAEDRSDQWYGRRAVLWVRLEHRETKKRLLFANHHGPLPLHSGGLCGGKATAYNILKVLDQKSQPGDLIVLAGDFNAGPSSETVMELERGLHRIFTGKSFGGVDNFFSNCAGPVIFRTRNLGSGGSDHEALLAAFTI